MATQVIRTGDSLAVQISEEMLQQAKLAVGDPVEWKLTEEGTLELQIPHDIDGLLGSEEGYEEWVAQEIEAGMAEHEAGQSVDGG